MRRIETAAELEALYDAPVPASLSKVADHLTPSYRRWVEAARFCVISTVGAGLLLGAALLLAGASRPADAALFVAAYAVAAITITMLGLLLGTLLPTTRSAQAVGLLLWFVALFLSGSGPPPEVLPDGLRTIGDWLPLTPVVRLLQEPWLTGDWLVRESLVAVGVAVASGAVAWAASRWA